MANARESRAEQLRKRQQASKENAGKTPFDFDRYFTTPDSVPIWNPKGDDKGVAHYVDILPFIMGDKAPTNIASQKTQAGEWDYKLEVYIHRNIGPNDKVVLCPFGNFGLPCPVCEHGKELLAEETDEDERKKIRQDKYPKRQVMYNVWVHDDSKEEEKGVQVWSVAHFFFEDKIKDLESEDGSEVILGDVSNDLGRQIKFIVEKKGRSNMEYKGHSFKKRVGYEIPAEIGDEGAYSLDSFLKPLMSYDELRDLYWGKDQKEEDDDKKSEEKSSSSSSPPANRRTLKSMKSDTATKSDEKKDTKPTLSIRRETKEVKEESVDTASKSVSEEKSEPASAPEENRSEEASNVSDNVCPENYEFGVDTLKKPKCNDCDDKVYRACAARKKELAKSK